VKTYPELRTNWGGRPPVEFPDPLPCSGYRPGPGPGGLERFDICTCCNCWVDEAGEEALISNNQFVENNSFQGAYIAQLPIDFWRFNIRYFIKVEQLSVSEEIYAFWKLVKSQQDGEGSLFQPNSVKVRGNIRSVTDPEEEILGIFAVSSVTSKEVFIERKDIPLVLTTDSIRGSCLGQFRGSTNTKPIFW
jgi:hypothetical protein